MMPVENARDLAICRRLLSSLTMLFTRLHVEVTSFADDWQRLSGLCLDHGVSGQNRSDSC